MRFCKIADMNIVADTASIPRWIIVSIYGKFRPNTCSCFHHYRQKVFRIQLKTLDSPANIIACGVKIADCGISHPFETIVPVE